MPARHRVEQHHRVGTEHRQRERRPLRPQPADDPDDHAARRQARRDRDEPVCIHVVDRPRQDLRQKRRERDPERPVVGGGVHPSRSDEVPQDVARVIERRLDVGNTACVSGGVEHCTSGPQIRDHHAHCIHGFQARIADPNDFFKEPRLRVKVNRLKRKKWEPLQHGHTHGSREAHRPIVVSGPGSELIHARGYVRPNGVMRGWIGLSQRVRAFEKLHFGHRSIQIIGVGNNRNIGWGKKGRVWPALDL